MAAGRQCRVRLMEAFILAAGLGTRLGTLTAARPKALVPVAGVPMIERVATRLIEAGADRLIINTHHFGEQIVDFVERRGGFGVQVAFSPEPERPLETGGGLLQASSLFQTEEPFFIHNADILTSLPLRSLYESHLEREPLVTLAVMERETGRHLLFDDTGLFGRTDEGKGLQIEARAPRGRVQRLAFAGIHVASARLRARISETGVFSILEPYLRLAAAGETIAPFRVDGFDWYDVGKPEQLTAAEGALKTGKGEPSDITAN